MSQTKFNKNLTLDKSVVRFSHTRNNFCEYKSTREIDILHKEHKFVADIAEVQVMNNHKNNYIDRTGK